MKEIITDDYSLSAPLPIYNGPLIYENVGSIPLETSINIGFVEGDPGKILLKLCSNGDIYVKGELTENNKEVVDAVKEFFLNQARRTVFCCGCGVESSKW